MKKIILLVLGLMIMATAVAATTFTQVGDVGVFTLDSAFVGADSAIAEDSQGNIHIVWEDSGYLRYEKYSSSGTVLVPAKTVAAPAYRAYQPSIDIDSNDNIHLVYAASTEGDFQNFEIFYKKLDSEGNTLIIAKKIYATDSKYNSAFPDVKVDSENNVHLTWSMNGDSAPVIGALYYAKLNGADASFLVSPKEIVTDNTGFSKIDVDNSGNAHIAYEHITGTLIDNVFLFDAQVAYVKLNGLNGNIIYGPVDETSDAAMYLDTEVDIGVDSSGNVHLVWSDNRAGAGYNLFYKKLDGSGNVLVDEKPVTFNLIDVNSVQPSLAVDSNDELVVVYTSSTAKSKLLKLDNDGNIVSGPILLATGLNPVVLTGSPPYVSQSTDDGCQSSDPIGTGGGPFGEGDVPEMSNLGVILAIAVIAVFMVGLVMRKNKLGKKGMVCILILIVLLLAILYGCTLVNSNFGYVVGRTPNYREAGDCMPTDPAKAGADGVKCFEGLNRVACKTKSQEVRCGCTWYPR